MPNRIFWTRQAREDLREVRAFIARDAPAAASAFVRRLRQCVERLRMFPCSGGSAFHGQGTIIGRRTDSVFTAGGRAMSNTRSESGFRRMGTPMHAALNNRNGHYYHRAHCALHG